MRTEPVLVSRAFRQIFLTRISFAIEHWGDQCFAYFDEHVTGGFVAHLSFFFWKICHHSFKKLKITVSQERPIGSTRAYSFPHFLLL